MDDEVQKWIEELLKSSKIKSLWAELEAFYQYYLDGNNIDYDREFSRTSVADIAYKAVERVAVEYNNNTSFAASFKLLESMCDETFVRVYKATRTMTKVNEIFARIRSLHNIRGMVGKISIDYKLKDIFTKYDKKLRIYRGVWALFCELCNHMEVDPSYMASVLLLKGTKHDDLYKACIEKFKDGQALRFSINFSIAAQVAMYYNDEVSLEIVNEIADSMVRYADIDDHNVRKHWKVLNTSMLTRRIVKKYAKSTKVTTGKALDRLIIAGLPIVAILDSFDDDGQR